MAALRDEHVGATRDALLTAARRRFGTVGFTATSLDDVVADAGVTKGALYHHFRNKEHLFREVYEQIEGELTGTGADAVVGAANAVEMLQRAFGAFLDAAVEDPEIRRISLLDAPSVLSAEQKHEIDARHSLAGVQLVVAAGMAEGQLVALDAEAVAKLLMAACGQAAIDIATAGDRAVARTQVGAALDHLIAGFAPRP